MIKLKTLILEYQYLEKIDKVVNTDVNPIIDTKTTLYRATRDDFGTFQKKEIRKDRKPRDMADHTHALIETLRVLYFPDKPSRSQVLFTTTSEKYSHEFGQNVYAVLPSRNCKLYYMDADSSSMKDSLNYISSFGLHYMNEYYKNMVNQNPQDIDTEYVLNFIKEHFPSLPAIMDSYLEKRDSDYIKLIPELLGGSWETFENNYKILMSRSSRNASVNNFKYQFDDYVKYLKRCYTYWTLIKEVTDLDDLYGINAEVQIFGDYVYLVEQEIFEDYKVKYLDKSSELPEDDDTL